MPAAGAPRPLVLPGLVTCAAGRADEPGLLDRAWAVVLEPVFAVLGAGDGHASLAGDAGVRRVVLVPCGELAHAPWRDARVPRRAVLSVAATGRGLAGAP
ncbi:hypothetical protein [Actinomadura roseirufa]|uniref:hypothetical protein n=1 Tax=Actinomadura roseirufa TaxID=2094049 RepID=UPI0013F16EA0|nr:hypothetical protein [Actinomadura roseirufa]